jgi:hypothetical protein
MISDADEFRKVAENLIDQLAANDKQAQHLSAQIDGLEKSLQHISSEEIVTVANGLKMMIQAMHPPSTGETQYLLTYLRIMTQVIGAEMIERDDVNKEKLDGYQHGEWDIVDL